MEGRAKKKLDQMDTKKQKAVAKVRDVKEKAKAEAIRSKKHAKKKQPHLLALNEWNELAADERAYKKLRKRKITKEEYEDILEVVNIIVIVYQATREIVILCTYIWWNKYNGCY